MVIYLEHYRRTAMPLAGTKSSARNANTMRPTPASVVYLFNDVAKRTIRSELPFDLTKIDVDGVLGKIYARATQI